MNITRHRVNPPKRYPMYPSNGLSPTSRVIEIDGDKRWRRVYERWDLSLPSGSKSYSGQPVPVVKVKDEVIDLTKEQQAQIGWDRTKPYPR